MTSQPKNLISCLFMLSLIPLVLVAGTTGKIAGKVVDAQTGESLPGANIVVEGTSLGASTDIEGNYIIMRVPPGVYTVIASFVGYKRVQVENIRVSVDFTTTVNITMEPGDIELEPIVVQGERTPLVRKDLTNPVASISSEALDELPLTDINEIIGLQAGVTVDDDGSIHIRGGFGNEIAFTLNGVNINNPYGNTRSVGLATNAVQEVSVSSGTFSAEYGTALSGVVNYVTKEGGRKFTGGWKYYTGDHVSGRKDLFFNIDDRQPANVYRFEGAFGGPLLVEPLSFYASGVYDYFGGSLYGRRIYRPEDSYLSREGFPSSDPRRGASSDPYYFGPYSHESTDLVGGPSGDGAIVPMNWRRTYNMLGNLSYRFSPSFKLKYEVVLDYTENPDGAGNSGVFANRFKPDGRRLEKSWGYFHSLDLTHVLTERIFYTLKASYIIDRGSTRAYEQYDDPRYLPSFYLRGLGNSGFFAGGTDLFRFFRETETFSGKFDLVAQLFNIHELKFGLEVRSHRLTAESYTLQFRDPNFPDIDPSPSNLLTGNYNFKPFIPTVEGGYIDYVRRPLQASGYMQDKIELFESIILNLGLRYDYFDAAAQYNPAISEELTLQDTIFVQKNLQDAPKKHMVSPRVSVSYPITDAGTIRFSYGHFYQIGSLSSLYSNPNFRAPLGTTPSFGNPNVNPQRSVQYELGLQQGLTSNLKIEVTAYYKDVRDYIFFQTIITPRGDRQYSVLTNLSYANTRGVSISLLKRRSPSDPLSLSLDYTFQTAEGNRTQPTEEIFFNEQKGQLSETYLVPMSFDRSHTITTTATLSQPGDWVASIIGFVRTGTPYTPSFPSNIVPITFIQNSDRQSLQWNVDLKVEKFFRIAGFDYSIFLQVDNLFDTQNELFVYANSGRALYNIEETNNPFQFQDLTRRITRGDPGMIPLDAVENYYSNPGNLNSPRLVRLGMSMTF